MKLQDNANTFLGNKVRISLMYYVTGPVLALVGNIVLSSWARHFTLAVAPSTQGYKWVPANLMLGVTLRWTSIPSKREWKYS